MFRISFRAYAACFVLLISSYAHAGVVYQFSWIVGTGDTVGLAGMDDAGDLLLAGYGDSGGKSRVINRGGRIADGFVNGLPKPDGLSEDTGVAVDAINSAGDMIGNSLRIDPNGVLRYVKTFWRDGVAYDMTDLANSHLTFVSDPGARIVQVDLSALQIVEAPPELGSSWRTYLPNYAFTNARGEYGFTTSFALGRAALLVPFVVPEPGTAALAVIAMVGLSISVRRKTA